MTETPNDDLLAEQGDHDPANDLEVDELALYAEQAKVERAGPAP